MTLEALFDSSKGNPLQKLVNNYWNALEMRSLLPSYPQDSKEYSIVTKLDSAKAFMEELKEVVEENPNKVLGLADLDSNGLRDELEKMEKEEGFFLRALLDVEFEGAWKQTEENSRIAEDFIKEFLAREEAYSQSFLPLTPDSMVTNSDNTSDEEHHSSKRQRTEKDAIAYASIFEAAENGDIQGVEYYLANGVKINAPDDFGDTVLHNAARNGHDSLIKHLLEHHHDLDINALDADNDSVLMQAAIFNKEAVVRVLLEHKANPNICDVFGNTPVHVAAENSNLNILKLLKEYGADLKALNKSMWSVMHSAAVGITTKAEKWDMIKWLLENGVSPSSKDVKEVSVSDVFYRKDCSYLIHYEQLVGEIQPIEE